MAAMQNLYWLINSYLAFYIFHFSFWHFSMTTLLQLGVYNFWSCCLDVVGTATEIVEGDNCNSVANKNNNINVRVCLKSADLSKLS